MKVVYNGCYGGFGLSHKAIMRYAELKGITLHSFAWTGGGRASNVVPVEVTEANKDELGLIHYCTSPEYSNGNYWSDRDIERDDPVLVQVVEELGKEANGMCAKLCIDNVPAGTHYRIDEYDGNESVMTQDSYDWRVSRED